MLSKYAVLVLAMCPCINISDVSENVEQADALATASADALADIPVTSLSDLLTLDVISNHLSSLLEEELRVQYGDVLPENTAPTKEAIMGVIRTGFFDLASRELSQTILSNNVGHILALSLGYDYRGEGLDAFLSGLRQLLKK